MAWGVLGPLRVCQEVGGAPGPRGPLRVGEQITKEIRPAIPLLDGAVNDGSIILASRLRAEQAPLNSARLKTPASRSATAFIPPARARFSRVRLIGSIVIPSYRAIQCRCGPSPAPVLPTRRAARSEADSPASLVALVRDNVVSRRAAKGVYAELAQSPNGEPKAVAERPDGST